MVAVANAIVHCGGRPKFVDAEPETGNPCARAIEIAANDDSVSSVIYAHLYGVPGEVPEVRQPIIEDCAECHGSDAGSRGVVSCYSFYANKIVTCGEGGMVIARTLTVADRMRSLRSHAFTPGNHFQHSALAHGSRMTDMQAALGIAQLSRMDEFLQKRRELADHYCQRLARVPWITWQPHPPRSVWWVMPVLVRKARWNANDRDTVRFRLAEHGIETRTYFKPLHRQEHLKRFVDPGQEFPVANDLYYRGLYLPLYPDLTHSDVDYICDVIEGL